MNTGLHIRLLGEVGLELAGDRVTGLPSRKAEALLIYLACHKRPFSREILADLLWDDRSQKQALANLRSILSSLRRVFDPYLIITRQTAAFNHDSDYYLDTAEFERLLETARPETTRLPDNQTTRLKAAIALYRGDFLSGFYLRDNRGFEEWATAQRERWQRKAIIALRQLVSHVGQRGQYQAGIQYAGRLLQLDPFNEEARRQMMLLLARTGQRAAALAQFETCRRLLAEELDVTPMAETAALYERIKTADPSRHNLPPQTTPFVGRQAELATINQRLAQPDCRLLTLVGPGGIGKTRLALQAAADNVGRFLNGVYHVPLAPVHSAEFLVATIADSLGIAFSGSAGPEAELFDYLRQKEMLLLLDNFEHLLDSARLLAEMMQNAPHVKLLVTSRERLNLRGEWLLGVEGLAFPSDADGETAVPPDTYSAIQLFLQTARRIQSDFALTAANAPSMIRICRLLQGVPLGIELAASWIRLFSCRQIAGEIEANLDFLSTSLQDMPDRHQSLRAVFDHSWRLLAKSERTVAKKLSVFQGTFDRAAAQEVAGASPLILISLVDKSFLGRHETGQFEMHQLLRQYMAEKLAAAPGEQEATRNHHCRYYAGFLNQQELALKGERQKEALAQIGAVIEDVRAAWGWAVRQQDLEALSLSLESLYLFYWARSWLQEGRAAFAEAAESVLAVHGENAFLPARIQARQAEFCAWLGDNEQARALFQKSVALLRALPAQTEQGAKSGEREAVQKELAFTIEALGRLNYLAGQYGEARRQFQESLDIYRQIGNKYGMAQSLNALANAICDDLADYGQAQPLYEESLAIARQIGDRYGEAKVLINQGANAQQQGDYVEAKWFYEESLRIYQEIDYRHGVSAALNYLGQTAAASGEFASARKLIRQSLDLNRESGNRRTIASSLKQMGKVACEMGAYRESKARYDEALRLAQEIQSPRLILEILAEAARLLAKEGKRELALELLACVQHQPGGGQELADYANELFVELAEGIAPPVAAACRERGQAKKVATAVAEILA